MSHNTPEDYAIVNKVIAKMFKANQSKNYSFNHGELVDVLQERIKELQHWKSVNSLGGNHTLSNYIKGKIDGIIEGAELLMKIVKEQP